MLHGRGSQARRADPDLMPARRLVLRLGAGDRAQDVGGRGVFCGTGKELRLGPQAGQALRLEGAWGQRAFFRCVRASALAMTPPTSF